MNRFKALISMCAAVALNMAAADISSPDGNLLLNVDVNAQGEPYYNLSYKGKPVIVDSKLGLVAKEAKFKDNFKILSTDTASFNETWHPVWGEYQDIVNHFNQLTVNLQNTDGLLMNVCFRVFNDGMGFRYEFPLQDKANYLAVLDEISEFNFPADHTLFAIPGDYDTDEYLFTEARISEMPEAMKKYAGRHSESQRTKDLEKTIQTPMLAKTDDGLYINIHEAALIGFPAIQLDINPETYGMKTHLTPDKLGVRGYIQLPFNTPWRTIIVSDDAREILASQLILNLNEPSKIEDTSWIKPMKFIGVWWEMFTGREKTWAYSDDYRAKPGVTDYTKLKPNGRHPANTENVKKYIDFAADHGIDAVLVEGWNEGWEDWASYRKNRQFLFDKHYPDFDLPYLRDYAKEKGVKLVMHHETAANAQDYERQLDRAFQFMKDNNYDAVKTGYVGAIIPRSEHHTSQGMVDHAQYVIEKAADYEIMIDSHEAPRPTGLIRTYPNWLAQESARGGEFESMGGNPPSHTAILPFTRLKGGPMDYTPGLFQLDLSYYNEGKTGKAMSTLARQLALYLTMPSPMQMAADLPENYQRFPDAFTFIEEVPVEWKDSKYLEAEPARYITVARQDKNSDDWFVGAITDDNARDAVIDFSFLEPGVSYEATIYADAPNAHYLDNQQAYIITKKKVNNKTKLKQHLAPGGGAAIKVSPIRK
ncbi:MAG: glycoside hydrolase family 97 protein [Muribaculaceae bacterium]|nr:glycoside hydrolase family 97 protein [Muribaculaceae bacterium]